MNAVCERSFGSVRWECLDHLIVLNERHLAAVLSEYVAYLNNKRPHQSIGQKCPRGSGHPATTGAIIEAPVLGGLHHDHRRAARGLCGRLPGLGSMQ
jgi:transposase InsO family protein